MLQSAIDLIKETIRPNSVFGCLSLVLVGVLLLYSTSTAKWGRRWLVAVLAGYWFISTPLGARLLVNGLSGDYHAIAQASEVPSDSAVIVLSGGASTFRAGGLSLDLPSDSTAFRVLEAARLYRLLGSPLIIASGGVVFPAGKPAAESDIIAKSLIDLGVPPKRIVSDSRSRNTEEQATELKTMLEARHIDHFVLVTSPTHMKRAVAVFKAAGLAPYPSVTMERSEASPAGWALLPDRGALWISDEAIYDYVALVYYWTRGRL
jgi:uncharacterized SAM-binding protein YcdF (DUF218 family)